MKLAVIFLGFVGVGWAGQQAGSVHVPRDRATADELEDSVAVPRSRTDAVQESVNPLTKFKTDSEINYQIGLMFLDGRAVVKDYSMAEAYFRKAIDSSPAGYEKAEVAISELRHRLGTEMKKPDKLPDDKGRSASRSTSQQ